MNPSLIIGGKVDTNADVHAGVDLPTTDAYGVMDPTADDAGAGFGKGTSARRSLVIWGVSVVWLVLVWRAVEGY